MTETPARRIALGVAGVYGVVAGAWIVLSDAALAWVHGDHYHWGTGQTLKGLAFVGATALILYALVRRGTETLARSEEAQRRHATELEALLTDLPALVFTVDRDLHVVSARGSLLDRFGEAAREWHGHPVAEFADEEVTEKLRRAVAGTETRYEYVWNGIVFEVVARPLADGAVAVAVDVTEQRRTRLEREELEERLRESEKIEAVGRLAGGIAHDFNNMLLAIRGYGEIAKREAAPGTRQEHAAAEILKAADRAAALTRQLLAYSRRQILTPEVFDLADLAATTSGMLRRLVGENHRLDVERGEDAPVRADRAQLEQVLVNLVVNARDAMPAGGRIAIRTGVGAVDGDRRAMLRVSDHGEGMGAETLERIFEPFFTTKDRGRGTGLGLATVQGVVSQSGGSVVVESQPGLGSTFTVYLPLADAPVAEPLAPPRQLHELPEPEGTVLLVEDDVTVRRVVAQMLEDAGYRVLAAVDGADALELARANEIAVLVTDLVMPDVDGRELARSVVAERPDVRVLLISGHVEGFANPDGYGLLEKPFTAQALVDRVRDVASSPPG